MNKLPFLLILILCLGLNAQTLPNPLVSPIQSGGYLPGIMGVRDYANPGADGLFVLDYNIFLSADKFYDRNGNNWIQSNPKKGFFVYMRLYGPLESYFDKSWKMPDIKKLK